MTLIWEDRQNWKSQKPYRMPRDQEPASQKKIRADQCLSVKSVVSFSASLLHVNDVRAMPQGAGQAAGFARGQDHVVILRDRQRIEERGVAAIGLDGGQVAKEVRQMQAAVIAG